MPHTKEVEEFLKSIGPFYEIADSDDGGERTAFTPNEMSDVMEEATNQSSQIQSRDPNMSADLDITNRGTDSRFNYGVNMKGGPLVLLPKCENAPQYDPLVVVANLWDGVGVRWMVSTF
jgi:hypothetical protein